jgi:hypothetical protein
VTICIYDLSILSTIDPLCTSISLAFFKYSLVLFNVSCTVPGVVPFGLNALGALIPDIAFLYCSGDSAVPKAPPTPPGPA